MYPGKVINNTDVIRFALIYCCIFLKASQRQKISQNQRVKQTENVASIVSDDEGQWKHKAGDVGRGVTHPPARGGDS